MKVNVLLSAIGLSLLALSPQAFTAEEASTRPTSTSILSASAPTSATDASEAARSPNAEPPPLPRLSEAEIETLQTDLAYGIESWFGWAGLLKIPAPPPLTDAVRNYRETWSVNDLDISNFLGLWRNNQDYPYYVSIFPTQTTGQVCVLEFKPEWSLLTFNEALGEYNKDVISEQVFAFSMATVENGHLRSHRVRSVGSAVAAARFNDYPVLLMGLEDNQDITRVVALESPPTLPPDLPEDLVAPVAQTLRYNGCIAATLSEG
ncbi:MAG: hypothetical protein AAGG53_16175 [Cyanobacteria bacterium P01_H01_bin.152]